MSRWSDIITTVSHVQRGTRFVKMHGIVLAAHASTACIIDSQSLAFFVRAAHCETSNLPTVSST